MAARKVNGMHDDEGNVTHRSMRSNAPSNIGLHKYDF